MSSIILAGGRSSRLGRDKAALVIGGITLLQRTVDLLSQLEDDIIIVLAPKQKRPRVKSPKKVKLIRDFYEGKGPLIGIYTGLNASSDEYSIVVACDMPFLNIDLLRYMKGVSAGFDAVAPRVRGEIEPLHAVYSRSCLDIIEKAINIREFRVRDLLGQIRVRYVEESETEPFDPGHFSWFNINTPEDLERAEGMIGKRHEI